MNITTPQFSLIQRMLDATWLRHQVVSQNVANVNTPGYETLAVSFEDEVQQMMRSGLELDPRSIPTEVSLVEGLESRADGNNVDIDRQMGALSKNALLHSVYSQSLTHHIQLMQSAIRGQ